MLHTVLVLKLQLPKPGTGYCTGLSEPAAAACTASSHFPAGAGCPGGGLASANTPNRTAAKATQPAQSYLHKQASQQALLARKPWPPHTSWPSADGKAFGRYDTPAGWKSPAQAALHQGEAEQAHQPSLELLGAGAPAPPPPPPPRLICSQARCVKHVHGHAAHKTSHPKGRTWPPASCLCSSAYMAGACARAWCSAAGVPPACAGDWSHLARHLQSFLVHLAARVLHNTGNVWCESCNAGKDQASHTSFKAVWKQSLALSKKLLARDSSLDKNPCRLVHEQLKPAAAAMSFITQPA